MKCKYCGAKGIKISHFVKKHGALMRRKAAASRARNARAASRSSGGSKTRVRASGGSGGGILHVAGCRCEGCRR